MDSQILSFTCSCSTLVKIDSFYAGNITKCSSCNKLIIIPKEDGGKVNRPTFKIQTKNLSLFPVKIKHWRKLYEVVKNENNYHYELRKPPSALSFFRDIWQTSFPAGLRKRYKTNIAIEKEEKVIGVIYLTYLLPYYAVNLGIMIDQPYQNKGIGSEALSELCTYLTQELNTKRISASCDDQNIACQKALQNVGLEKEGVTNRYFYHPERGWINAINYSLIAN